MAGVQWRRRTECSERCALLQARLGSVASSSSTVGQLGDGLAALFCDTLDAEASSVLMADHESQVLRRVGYCDENGSTLEDDGAMEPPPSKLDQGICGFAISRAPGEYPKEDGGIISNNDVSASGVFDSSCDHEVAHSCELCIGRVAHSRPSCA